ncbi:MAG: NHL repeat-containing protein [Candidatus Aminicenantia bacterium]
MKVGILAKRLIILLSCFLLLLSFSTKNSFSYPEEGNFALAAHCKNNALSSPVRIALSHGNKIYVTDFKKECVAVMNIKKNKIKVIKTIPINGNPLGVAVDHKGWIYVGNNSTNKVEVYTPGGKFKYSLEGEIKRPNDIAIASSGLIYVVTSDENLVKIYNPDGTYRSSFGGSGKDYGQFNFPTGIAIDDNNMEVVVSDFLNKRVQVFDYEGNWLRTIGGGWFRSVVDRPQGIAVDEQGRIYVVDPKQACILVLNQSGDLITTFGEYGQDREQLRIPLDIVIDRNGNAFVTSNQNSRVEIFKGVLK